MADDSTCEISLQSLMVVTIEQESVPFEIVAFSCGYVSLQWRDYSKIGVQIVYEPLNQKPDRTYEANPEQLVIRMIKAQDLKHIRPYRVSNG